MNSECDAKILWKTLLWLLICTYLYQFSIYFTIINVHIFTFGKIKFVFLCFCCENTLSHPAAFVVATT